MRRLGPWLALALVLASPATAVVDPVSVTVSADPGLAGGTILVRSEGGAWESLGTYVGYGDVIQLENHVRYDIKIEKSQLWSIHWGTTHLVPVKELGSNAIASIHEEEATVPNTRNILLAALAALVPVAGAGWHVLRQKRVGPPSKANAARRAQLMGRSQVFLPEDLTIGRYRLEELLGEGGMASVYKVVDDMKSCYAMKIPHAGACKDPNYVRRFEREISIAITFQHPNIIRVHDYGTYTVPDASIDHIPYFVMELATGTVLDQYLIGRAREGMAPDLPFAAKVGHAVAEALAAAHSHGIVHRDIKPANVILDDQGQIKVMDFGIAKADNQLTALTTGGVVGTPAYMAPEQVSRARPVDHRADLYALGALIYSMTTYTIPFWDEDMTVMITLKLTEPAPLASLQNPLVPPGLDAIMARLLERDPAERFQSAIEVLAALEYVERFPDRVPA